ncbi:uncharacterized protein BHQ10_009074 [Talaromyces amestolkiae]|uniref:Uncharacterized protein n=1 Tax=Talaromyces amestolkiae TaxID=1196081 RepID=A0A364LB79_TALAM|nr:uncharacterized protein BHQ10_009074 [Talaromyces amestolkiae]RAO73062.1 hypothetical protein BHQ10_009074 [Talaromyces amestolkiae]
MSNQDLRQPSEEGPQSMNEPESSSEGGSWYHRSDEDQENRPHADPNTQIVYTEFPPGTSASYDIERPEYGNDPVALRKAFKRAKRRQKDIDAERRSWYGEDADEVMEYQFRFTPEELRDRAAERHGGQTFYEHMVEVGLAQDLDRIVGDELEEELEENYERRMEEWRTGIHPDFVPDWDHGDVHNQGDDHNQGDNNQGKEHDDGNRDKDNSRLANSEPETSREYSDSGDRGDDEGESDTPSTDKTRAMPDFDSESKSQKRRRLSDDAFDSGRASKKRRTPEQSDNDEAAAMQVQREFYQSQPEQTEEPSEDTDVEYQRQQDERRDLFFRDKELRESLDRRQSGEQQPPQPQLQQQTQQQEFEEGEGEEVRPRTRLEYEREARLQHDLEYVLQHQEDIRAHLRGIQRRLDSTGGTEPNLRELWGVQMQNLELQRHREMRIQQRLRVLQQQSRIEDLQYRQNGLSEEIGRMRIEQDQVRERLERIGQQMRLHGYRADWRREEAALEEQQYQLGQQVEHLERRIFALQQQIAEMEADQRVQERKWDELRVQEDELVKANHHSSNSSNNSSNNSNNSNNRECNCSDSSDSMVSSKYHDSQETNGRRKYRSLNGNIGDRKIVYGTDWIDGTKNANRNGDAGHYESYNQDNTQMKDKIHNLPDM